MITKVDCTVVILYGILVAFLGYVAKRKVKSPEDYFAGGKSVPWWMAAISHHMSGYSAFAFVGHASVAYDTGFATYTMFALPIFIAMIIGAFVWAPRWARMKILTPIEYLEQRFNNTVRQVFAWSGIGIKFIDEGAKLYSLSIIVHVVTGWPLVQVIIACGVITVLYLLFGGLWATMLTDFAQFFVQFGITLILVPMVLKLVGGVSGLVAQMPENHTHMFNDFITPSFIFVKYGIPAIFGIETSFPLYTGLELLVSFTVFMLDGVWAKPKPEAKARVDKFFAQFESL